MISLHILWDLSLDENTAAESTAGKDPIARQKPKKRTVECTMEPHQTAFLGRAYWIEEVLDNWTLCDVMGLGKTMAALAFIVIMAIEQGASSLTKSAAGSQTEAEPIRGLTDLYIIRIGWRKPESSISAKIDESSHRTMLTRYILDEGRVVEMGFNSIYASISRKKIRS